MAHKDTNFQFIHVQVQLTLNENSYEWYDPRVYQNFSFSIPVAMFSTKQFAELIEAQVKALPFQLEAEKVRYEAEQKAKEEAEKAKSEAETLQAQLEAQRAEAELCVQLDVENP